MLLGKSAAELWTMSRRPEGDNLAGVCRMTSSIIVRPLLPGCRGSAGLLLRAPRWSRDGGRPRGSRACPWLGLRDLIQWRRDREAPVVPRSSADEGWAKRIVDGRISYAGRRV